MQEWSQHHLRQPKRRPELSRNRTILPEFDRRTGPDRTRWHHQAGSKKELMKVKISCNVQMCVKARYVFILILVSQMKAKKGFKRLKKHLLIVSRRFPGGNKIPYLFKDKESLGSGFSKRLFIFVCFPVCFCSAFLNFLFLHFKSVP